MPVADIATEQLVVVRDRNDKLDGDVYSVRAGDSLMKPMWSYLTVIAAEDVEQLSELAVAARPGRYPLAILVRGDVAMADYAADLSIAGRVETPYGLNFPALSQSGSAVASGWMSVDGCGAIGGIDGSSDGSIPVAGLGWIFAAFG